MTDLGYKKGGHIDVCYNNSKAIIVYYMLHYTVWSPVVASVNTHAERGAEHNL